MYFYLLASLKIKELQLLEFSSSVKREYNADASSSSMRSLEKDEARSSLNDSMRYKRDRSEKMADYYNLLQGMVPNLLPRVKFLLFSI